MEKNYYAILGVLQGASEAEIRARFKELVRRHHPDRFHGSEKVAAEERFQAITEAVNVLTSPERRRDHDFALAQPKGDKRGQEGDRVAQAYLQRGAKAFREKNRVQAAFDHELPSTLLFNYPTVDAVVGYLDTVLFGQRPAEPASPHPTDPGDDLEALLDNLEQLSDDEIDRMFTNGSTPEGQA